MAEHKTRKPDHRADSASGQEGSGRQHPTGTGPAYRAPSKRGSDGGTAEVPVPEDLRLGLLREQRADLQRVRRGEAEAPRGGRAASGDRHDDAQERRQVARQTPSAPLAPLGALAFVVIGVGALAVAMLGARAAAR